MKTQPRSFVILREDLEVDPLTVVTDGLKIGRLQGCDVVLNHPAISRLHAGVKEQDGDFYLYNFSHSTRTTLNGRVVQAEAAEVLADGDVLHIGPFFLRFERLTEALRIRVSMQVAAADAPDPGSQPVEGSIKRDASIEHPAVAPEVSNALSVFWSARKREAGKMQKLSPLRPHRHARVLGKSRFNWTPTRDLVRSWRWSIFVWGAVLVSALSVCAALGYTRAFSPAPLSQPHARTALTTSPAFARQPNANSCTTCHTLNSSMSDSCSSCHRTESFEPSVIKPHAEAGIGCASCHAEHRGESFSPSIGALRSCSECHTDSNARKYNGRRVGTPHGGTFGYPVKDAKWIWKGFVEAEWAAKPVEIRRAVERWPVTGEDARRSAQFHAIHLHRVRTPEGLTGTEAGEVSCSTCHQRFSPVVDRETPRTTCAACHNGDVDKRFDTQIIASDAPNCTSCHVQHPKGRRLWGATLVASSGESSNNKSSEKQLPPRP